MESPELRPPEPLSASHDLAGFDCGMEELNLWLVANAAASEGLTARTYVVAAGSRVAAYYCLATGAVVRGALPSAKLRRNTPNEIPVVVIGRLAVDKRFQNRGLGPALLRDAILRALSASELVGMRAILVHAIDDAAVGFYKKFGFLASPLNPRTLVLPIETARRAL
jgi:GNAT superfamily N-acetyltransferase